LREWVGSVGCPETDQAAGEVDVVGEVVPVVGDELGCPLRLTVDVPAQGVIGGTSFAVDQSVFDLSKVALEESNLMLKSWIGRILGGGHKREVVV